MTKSRQNWKSRHDGLKAENERLKKALKEIYDYCAEQYPCEVFSEVIIQLCQKALKPEGKGE